MRRVAITGLGAVTPFGLDERMTGDAAVTGRSGVVPIPKAMTFATGELKGGVANP